MLSLVNVDPGQPIIPLSFDEFLRGPNSIPEMLDGPSPLLSKKIFLAQLKKYPPSEFTVRMTFFQPPEGLFRPRLEAQPIIKRCQTMKNSLLLRILRIKGQYLVIGARGLFPILCLFVGSGE
jgi:hypothetical protein